MSVCADEEIERDFQDFLSFCKSEKLSSKEMREICKPLIWNQRWRMAKRFLVILTAALVVWLLYDTFEVFSWTASAFVRIFLIKLLPYWDWTSLYNARCLIAQRAASDKAPILTTSILGRYEADFDNCVLCEKIDLIPTVRNVTFSALEERFLERGLPVIISDSHQPKSLDNILTVMRTKSIDFLDSDPCDVATNLMLRKFFNLGTVLDKIVYLPPNDRWFLQVRNCQFKSVKSSRRFVTRPYYYPVHLEPFYSSWILMANRYYHSADREIYMQGVIFVQQLSGELVIRLRPKTPCNKTCPDVNAILRAGECLVFSTDLWIFKYASADSSHNDDAETSITTILEIDWRL